MTGSIFHLFAAFTAVVLMAGPARAGFIPGPSAPEKEVEALERRTATLSGKPSFEISYLTAGPEDAPRLIFIHGTPGSAHGWGDYLVKPFPGWRSIAYDRPGFGRTKPKKPVDSLVVQARVAGVFLAEEGGRKPIVIGHSLGGPIACRLAADRPNDVGALVILAGSVDPAEEKITWYQRLARWRLARAVLPTVMLNANDEVWPLKQELERLEPLLTRITCPVIIVHGDDDGLVPVANARWLAKRLTGSAKVEVTIIHGQNHLLPWNNVPAVRKAIERAIELDR